MYTQWAQVSTYYNPISVLLPARPIIREFIVDLVLTINCVTVAVLGVGWLGKKANRIKFNYSSSGYPKLTYVPHLSCH